MSQSQHPNKHITTHSSDELIRAAIRKIANKGLTSNGVLRGTARVTGYVAKIHDDEEDELYGTIDVQEYPDWAVAESEEAPIGYHEGVYLTALQNDREGYVMVPKLHSEVLVSQDPVSGIEYVTMFSHVDYIQLDSHDSISVGVREREEYDPDDDEAPDIHELELTGVQSNTSYTKNSIVSTVQGESASDHTTQLMNEEKIRQEVGDDKTHLEMTQDGLNVTHDKGTLDINDSESTLAMGSSKVKVEDGTVYLGSDSGTDDAVLGKELAGILSDLVGYLGQMMTPTMMGPQPPANVLGSFISLKAKIDAFKASSSGFLTKKVQVQK